MFGELIGKILVERAAEVDVHHLHATADAEYGNVELVGVVQDEAFNLFAFWGEFAQVFVVPYLTVAARIDILATAQDESVDQPEQALVYADVFGERQNQGDAAAFHNRIGLIVRNSQNVFFRKLGGYDSDNRTPAKS